MAIPTTPDAVISGTRPRHRRPRRATRAHLVTFFPDAPNNVDHTDQDSVRGHVLSNGIDANGRIGFIYAGDPVEPDGAQVFLWFGTPTRASGGWR